MLQILFEKNEGMNEIKKVRENGEEERVREREMPVSNFPANLSLDLLFKSENFVITQTAGLGPLMVSSFFLLRRSLINSLPFFTNIVCSA